MRRAREAYAPDLCARNFFVTSITWQRRSLFRAEAMARLFLKVLCGYRRQSKYQHASVLMPEHFHLLLTPARELTLERVLRV